MYLKKEVFLIFGMAKSGLSCGKFLLKNNAICYFYEDNKEVVNSCEDKIKEWGGVVVEKEDLESVLNKITILILSPGVPIDNPVAKKAKSLGKRIMGELELGVEMINSPMIAITGTNGKTTSTYLLEHIINVSGVPAYAVGNIGVPITSVIGSVGVDNVLVTEVSSYQLETCNRILPHVAVILNITPDHLSRHYTMENYVYLKGKLLKNLRESEYAVLNYDDEYVKGFGDNVRAKVVYFSREKILENGVYVSNDKIFYKEEFILDVKELSLKGNHNLSNVLACVAVCKILKIPNETIINGIKSFKGAKHRLELIKEVNKVDYYNDSKSTNPDSTIKAIESMDKNCVLLLGGKPKSVDYKTMFNFIKDSKVEEIVLFGEARFDFFNIAREVGLNNIHLTKNLSNAVILSSKLAKENYNVLLSPACSSYDEFMDYEERGEKFISVVSSLYDK